MLELTIKGVAPFDGTYPLGLSIAEFRGRELNVIKQVAGIRMGEIESALDAQDYDLIVALAAISLCREGKIQPEQTVRVAGMLMDAMVGAITVQEIPEVEDEEVPPSELPNGSESENEQDES